ncbi:MAG TPA: phosphoglycerate dehydrogenase [bacterium]
MKVLVTDNLSAGGVEILKKAGSVHVDVKNKIPPDELKNILGEYNGIIVRSTTKLSSDVIAGARKLKVIGRAGVGFDNIDINAATKHGIVVMNTPGGNSITTAEHTIAMMLSMVRKIPQATASMKAEKWEKNKFLGMELYNKILGVAGLGNIGAIVADRGLGLKMRVIAYDPFISEEKAHELGVELVSLDELFNRSDIITVHVPLTKETKGLINRDTISRMKNGVCIINCARGGIVDEEALTEAIKSGKVACAALDVFEKEPPGKHPLCELENVVLTPHLGASTAEAQENVALAIAEQVVDFLVHGVVRNAVNFPAIPSEALGLLKPYINLSEKIGKFMSYLVQRDIEMVSIEYSGEISSHNIEPLTFAALKGLLERTLTENVNYINAPVIAKERGLKVVVSKTTSLEDYASLITIKLKAGKDEFVIAGTIFGKKDAKIVKFDSYRIDVLPEGNILLLYNWDKPGVLGAIGTYLGKSGMNIAGLQLGRDKPGGKAVSFVHVDGPIPDNVLEEVKKLDNVISAQQISL